MNIERTRSDYIQFKKSVRVHCLDAESDIIAEKMIADMDAQVGGFK